MYKWLKQSSTFKWYIKHDGDCYDMANNILPSTSANSVTNVGNTILPWTKATSVCYLQKTIRTKWLNVTLKPNTDWYNEQVNKRVKVKKK